MAAWGKKERSPGGPKTHPCGKRVPLIQSEGVFLMGDMKNQSGPVIGDHAEIIQAWPFHRGQNLAGGLEGTIGRFFP